MERGFSILEAIVALALIVTGVVALAGLAARATDTVVRARQRSAGVHLADAALTELAARGVPPSMPGCLLSDVAGCVEYRDSEGRPAAGPAAAYAVRWYAAAVPASPVSGHDSHRVCGGRARACAKHPGRRRLRDARADGAVAMRWPRDVRRRTPAPPPPRV